MKLILAGGTGFIGKRLAAHFSEKGHEIVILSRKPYPSKGNIRYCHWNGETPGDWVKELDGADVVINLAGRSINCRYTEKNKKEIIDSRLHSTQVIGDAINSCIKPPSLWINMSSSAIYENSESAPQDEYSGKIGNDFAMNVSKDWERTFYNCVTPSTRKIVTRLSIVLGREAGALRPYKLLAILGAAGKMGSGRQMISWIHIDDVVRSIEFLINNESLSGIFNITSPNAETNAAFMRTLRKVVGMPIGIPSAPWMIRVGAFIIGTDPDFILQSRWAIPKKLMEAGFQFAYPDLVSALRKELNKPPVVNINHS